MSKLYFPKELVKHHCDTKGVTDSEFGELIEKINTNFIKLICSFILYSAMGIRFYYFSLNLFSKQHYAGIAVLVVLLAYAISFIIRIFKRVELYKSGFIVRGIFGSKRVSYETIYSIKICKVTDKIGTEADYRQGLASTLLRLSRTYKICVFKLADGKIISLKAPNYFYLIEKAENLKENLENNN